ncbi:hypothetical protein [Neisseria lactamica]|uniref:hypothetical protein n=1 Tax=Neisseria lactamica TaxID=486 RepID=UPI000E5905DA|nr:hypothetical protein [Neisseria lactamica]
MFMIGINILASLAIIAHCGCRLSVQQWKMRQPELWIHALLLAASTGVAASNLSGQAHNPYEVLLNVGVASYFLAQTWRLRHLDAKDW